MKRIISLVLCALLLLCAIPALAESVSVTEAGFGGDVTVTSRHEAEHPDDHGTTVTAVFHTDHIDCPPLGDVIATVTTLIQGHPDTEFLFRHEREGRDPVELDTRELRLVLEDVPLDSYEVLQWIQGFLRSQE